MHTVTYHSVIITQSYFTLSLLSMNWIHRRFSRRCRVSQGLINWHPSGAASELITALIAMAWQDV